MGNSWGFAYTGMYPPYLSAWARLKLGWLEAESPVPGAVSQVEASVLPLDGIPKVYMIGNGDAGFAEGEYLLIENRQAYGYDVYIPTTVSNCDEATLKITWVRPWDLALTSSPYSDETGPCSLAYR